MDIDEMWRLLKPEIDEIRKELKEINTRSHINAWNIKALWACVIAEFGFFVYRIRGLIAGK